MNSVPVHLGDDITVGMAAYGGQEVTRVAIECLLASAEGDFQLLLVDDASPDATIDVFRWASQNHRNTRIIQFPNNMEYVHAVNAILSHSTGRLVAFVSNDYLLTPAWFRQIIGSFDANHSVGIVTGTSSYCDNLDASRNLLNSEFVFVDSDELFAFAEGISKAFLDRPLLPDRIFVGDAFVVSRAVLDRIGTFDTSFVGYMADQEFALRCKRAQFSVMVNQAAFGYHVKNANIAYLDERQQAIKIRSRFRKTRLAFRRFVDKYGLTSQITYGQEEGPVLDAELLTALALAEARMTDDQLFVAALSYERFFLPGAVTGDPGK